MFRARSLGSRLGPAASPVPVEFDFKTIYIKPRFTFLIVVLEKVLVCELIGVADAMTTHMYDKNRGCVVLQPVIRGRPGSTWGHTDPVTDSNASSFNHWLWNEAEYPGFERDSPGVAALNGGGGLTREIRDLGPPFCKSFGPGTNKCREGLRGC